MVQIAMKLTRPLTGEEEVREIEKVLASETLTQGPAAERFEQLVARRVGTEFGFATSSCTTALHLTLAALNIGSGDEVAVADFTHPASGNVILQQGATPVLIDIELPNLTISVDELQAKLGPKTKAVIVVHAFGRSADMDPIVELCRSREITVIEDAATALGSTYKGRQCGSLGDVGCFSFHPRKIITTGEGGVITTDDAELAGRLQVLRAHGAISGGRWPEFEQFGFNYRLSDILGAIGVAQMERLDEIIASRRRLAAQLREALAMVSQLTFPEDPPWGESTYQSFVVMCSDRQERDHLLEHLSKEGIEATLGTYALHAQPSFGARLGMVEGDLPNSAAAFARCITLPLFPQMIERDIAELATAVRGAFR
jgi:dTDP-4-amino-4,6-dideoxygalactose transaminase